MKKAITVMLLMLCSLCLLPSAMAAVDLTAPLEGAVYYPDGASFEDAKYVFSYRLPQVHTSAVAGEGINAYYQILQEEMLFFTAPIQAEISTETQSEVQMYTRIDYQVTLSSDDYFSVITSTEQFMGAASTQMIRGQVFSLHGAFPGQVVTLPTMLSFDDDTAATRVIDTVYDLVWEVIEEQLDSGEFYEGLTQEDMFAEFYPEEDFYLDESGNIVFFIQPGMISIEAAGLLSFPFAPEEILSAM